MDRFISQLPRLQPRDLTLIGSSIAATLALLTLSRHAFHSKPPKIIPSPITTLLPKLSKPEQDALPYPPNVFPGAREVKSPYGIFRAYEFGPELGSKVLLIHGISTPCLALSGIANGLVDRGCRVLLLDLWGRGYSDSVDLPHDSRLYTTQILLAITSSSLPWTPDGFALVGYSLGGGIAADFAASFPNIITHLVLLAPSGLIRPQHFGWQSKLLYSELLPDWLVEKIVQRRLGGAQSNASSTKQENAEKAVQEEIKGNGSQEFNNTPLSKSRPELTVAGAVKFQFLNHTGFVRSFVSSIRFSSIAGTKETRESWHKLSALREKVILMVGKTDPLIVAKELQEDASNTIGIHKVEFRVIEGGHEFPIARPDDVVNEIAIIWGL